MHPDGQHEWLRANSHGVTFVLSVRWSDWMPGMSDLLVEWIALVLGTQRTGNREASGTSLLPPWGSGLQSSDLSSKNQDAAEGSHQEITTFCSVLSQSLSSVPQSHPCLFASRVFLAGPHLSHADNHLRFPTSGVVFLHLLFLSGAVSCSLPGPRCDGEGLQSLCPSTCSVFAITHCLSTGTWLERPTHP